MKKRYRTHFLLSRIFPSLLFFGLFLLSVTSLPAQTTQLSMPDSASAWVGEWEGTLEIWKGPVKLQAIPAYLKIVPSDTTHSLLWTTRFGERKEKTIEKPYELKIMDSVQGLYLLDEHNSIQLESYWVKDKLLSWYEVSGNLILASYEMRGTDQILFEIIAGKTEPVSVTGGATVGEEEIPEVRTFPISVIQRALFKRIDTHD
jgi:hypothetical protein